MNNLDELAVAIYETIYDSSYANIHVLEEIDHWLLDQGIEPGEEVDIRTLTEDFLRHERGE